MEAATMYCSQRKTFKTKCCSMPASIATIRSPPFHSSLCMKYKWFFLFVRFLLAFFPIVLDWLNEWMNERIPSFLCIKTVKSNADQLNNNSWLLCRKKLRTIVSIWLRSINLLVKVLMVKRLQLLTLLCLVLRMSLVLSATIQRLCSSRSEYSTCICWDFLFLHTK